MAGCPRSQAICALLADEPRLTQERALAAQKRRQYEGYSRDDLPSAHQARTLSEISLPQGADDLPSPLRRTVSWLRWSAIGQMQRSKGMWVQLHAGVQSAVLPRPAGACPDSTVVLAWVLCGLGCCTHGEQSWHGRCLEQCCEQLQAITKSGHCTL